MLSIGILSIGMLSIDILPIGILSIDMLSIDILFNRQYIYRHSISDTDIQIYCL